VLSRLGLEPASDSLREHQRQKLLSLLSSIPLFTATFSSDLHFLGFFFTDFFSAYDPFPKFLLKSGNVSLNTSSSHTHLSSAVCVTGNTPPFTHLSDLQPTTFCLIPLCHFCAPLPFATFSFSAGSFLFLLFYVLKCAVLFKWFDFFLRWGPATNLPLHLFPPLLADPCVFCFRFFLAVDLSFKQNLSVLRPSQRLSSLYPLGVSVARLT